MRTCALLHIVKSVQKDVTDGSFDGSQVGCASITMHMCAPDQAWWGARRLMQASGVKRSRAGVREGQRVEQLEEFAAACARVDFRPPLSAKQAAFLHTLQAERLY